MPRFENPPHLINKALTDFQPFLYKGGEAENIYWCPFCDDRKEHDHAHLYFEKKTGAWYCHSCSRGKYDIRYLFEGFGMELSYTDVLESLVFSNQDTMFLSATEDIINPLTKKNLDLFAAEAKPLGVKTEAFKYLNGKRGLSPQEIKDSWRVWTRHAGYVFWAVYDKHNQPLFYSGRKYYEKLDPKYLHLGSKVPLVILNSLKTMKSPGGRELLFLVEGIFDAYGAPAQAIPVFGKRLSAYLRPQVIDMIKANDYAVVCALDKEEIDSNFDLAQTFIDNGVREVYLFKLAPAKDFGERKYVQADRKEVLSRLTQYVGPVSQPLVRLFLKY